jgi:hypothetical protein
MNVEEKIVKSFATPEGCHLVVENAKGTIVVQGWDRLETEVVAVRHQEGAEVEITQDGNEVIARTKKAGNGGEQGIGQVLNWLTPNRTPVVDYTVHVPYASDVKLKNVNGPIHVKQTRGKVRVNNVDGPVTVEGIDGDVRAETVNGALHVVQLKGAADLKTVNGEMDVRESSLLKLAAQTVNGNVKIAATLDDNGQYTFNTVNGNCELLVPADFRARVSAHGVNLHVECTQPAQSIKRQFGSWNGTIGTGQEGEPAAEITFNTVNGHLRIDNGGPTTEPATEYVAKTETPPEAPEPPKPPKPPETAPTPVEVKVAAAPTDAETKSQLEVLQMVERGEISVEEAVQLLGE